MDNSAEMNRNPHRERQLIQVWKDYYDEIYEINLDNGSYVSLMGDLDGKTRSGLIELEVILMTESQVHPDDKEAFRLFFDRDHVLRRLSEGEYVEKLYFRLKDSDGSYGYIKAKYMTPTVQPAGDTISYVCFRRVDLETNKDMEYKRMQADRIKAAETEAANLGLRIEELSKRLRTPLSNVSGIAGIAKAEAKDAEGTVKRLEIIEQAALLMNDILNSVLGEDQEKGNAAEGTGLSDSEKDKIDESMYTYRNDSKLIPGEQKKPGAIEHLPEGYYISSNTRTLTEEDRTELFQECEGGLSGIHVLVAEDDEIAAEIMKEVLSSVGAEVTIATDGKSAVTTFVSRPAGTFSAVLMGLELPVIDGWMATRCIRISGKDDAETIPIFAITSKSYGDDVAKSYELGMNAHFIKPVDFRSLIKKLIELKK